MVAVCGSVGMPLFARANPPATPNVYRSLDAGKPAHDVGHLRGRVVSVDYAEGSFVVRTARGDLLIAILPNTTVSRGDRDAGISDVRPGQSVELSVYEVGGRLVARRIRLPR